MLRFADDIAIIAQDEMNLKRALESLDDILKTNYNLKINRKKTEVMVCSKDPENINIRIEDDALKQVPTFKYLGSIFTEDGRSKEDVKQRIREAKSMFNNKKQLLCSNSLKLETKKALIKSCIWSTALYGSETWTIGKNEEKTINAFETWCWRRMLKIKWTDRVTNEEVLQRAEEERTLLKTLKSRRHSWIGHIIRHNEFVTNIVEGVIPGKKARGRPRLQYLNQAIKNTGTASYAAMKRMACNNIRWKAANQSAD